MGVVADHMNEMQRLCETYWLLIHTLSNDPKLYEVRIVTCVKIVVTLAFRCLAKIAKNGCPLLLLPR